MHIISGALHRGFLFRPALRSTPSRAPAPAAFCRPARASHAPNVASQFVYRLTVCGELSLGLFTTSDDAPAQVVTASTAHVVESGAAPERKEFLLAHICATKTRNELISDDDMKVPPNWRDQPHPADATVGHQEDGRTIALHSLAVEPKFQGQGLGKTLLKAYVQRMQNSGVADRISILTYDRLVSFYESVGFENRGASKVQYGGGGWVDMVRSFNSPSSTRQEADQRRSWCSRRTPTARRREASRG